MHHGIKIMLCLLLPILTSCGGGGGSDGEVSVNFEQTSAQFTGSMSALTRYELGFTIQNLPKNGIHIRLPPSKNPALKYRETKLISDTKGVFYMAFRPGFESGGPGEVKGPIQLEFCYDVTCTEQISGSPVNLNINVNYAESALTNYPQELTASAEQLTTKNTATTTLELSNPLKDALYVGWEISGDGPLFSVQHTMLDNGNIELELYFDIYDAKFGLMHNSLSLQTCYDYYCTKQVTDGDATIDVTFDNSAADSAAPPITIIQQLSLPFEVIHAEMMPLRNAIAITSSWPENALYLLNLSDFSHTKVSLAKTPTSVAASDYVVAVGHDALISYIDFSTDQPQKTLLNVPFEVFDIALTTDKVHVTDAHYYSTNLTSFDVATGSFSSSVNGRRVGGSKIAVHPTQPWIYAASNNVSPDDIDKVDISTSPARWLYDSPYHGDYEFCGDLWISENGLRVYTKCGNTLRLSDNRDTDLTYTGQLALSTSFRVKHLVENINANEITLIEQGPQYCNSSYEPCFSRISTYSHDFLSHLELRTLPIMSINNNYYRQEAQAVFYNQDKTKRYMLSKLADMPSIDATFYVAEIAF